MGIRNFELQNKKGLNRMEVLSKSIVEISEQYEYFDDALYNERFVIERTNAWLDGFRGLVMRCEKKNKHLLKY